MLSLCISSTVKLNTLMFYITKFSYSYFKGRRILLLVKIIFNDA